MKFGYVVAEILRTALQKFRAIDRNDWQIRLQDFSINGILEN